MGADALCALDACALGERYARGEVSPVEVIDACLARIERLDPVLNAFITVTDEAARAEARQAERALQRGESNGRLHGIPVAIKDVIRTRGVRTTMGSSFYRDFVPQDDAAVVERLKREGAIVVGKTHTHEFAFAPVMSDNAFFGRCRNPWDLQRIAGASSGGSAVAVAAGLATLALGSDTSGSVRIPASLCGIVGLKPTRDRLDCSGVFPVAASLDTVGPMTRSARDAALAFSAMTGEPPHGPLAEDLRGVRIGVLTEHFSAPLDPEVRALALAAIDTLRAQGASVDSVSIPMAEQAPGIISVILGWEVVQVHQQRLRESPEGFGKETLDRLRSSLQFSADDYARARKQQAELTEHVRQVMQRYDVLAGPTMPVAAPAFAQEVEQIGAESYPLIPLFARFTRLHSLTGFPAISVPCGVAADARPVGLQLSGRPLDEGMVLRLAAAYERATPSLSAALRKPHGIIDAFPIASSAAC
jgi:aspartyl-tRNA(Asn)/glutamyl-tRNA(Gln) amidotransferase subunit A